MLKVDLYIDGVNVDMFDDENINITDSIQDIRDISKLFTSFTQDFSIPASKTNNKILKHWYNSDVNVGFDVRFPISAEIKVNGANYKRGIIKVIDTKLKNNKAYAYSIRFIGDGIDLANTLSDDTLDMLDLTAYNHTYSGATCRTGLENGLGLSGSSMVAANGTTIERSILYPLITHTKRYVYDSSNTPQFYDTTDGNRLEYTQLKPAIKVMHIIEAIESRYGIEFTRDFFDNGLETSNLYMWLNRHEGNIQGAEDATNYFNAADWSYTAAGSDDDIAYYAGTETAWLESYGKNSTNPDYAGSYAVAWEVDIDVTTTGTGKYDIYILNNAYSNELMYEGLDISGGSTDTISLEYGFNTTGPVSSWGGEKLYIPKIKVVSEGSITVVDATMNLTRKFYSTGVAPVVELGIYDIPQINTTSNIDIPSQIPKQKTIDFLIGLFKMFNLTAYKQDDGKIYVDTLDNFYSAGTERDITRYVDVSEKTVIPSALYDTVEFKYSDVESKLIKAREELIGDVYGDLSYSLANTTFTGGTYTIDVPFSHIMFERLVNVSSGLDTSMLTGLFVNSTDDPIATTEPLLFYYTQGTTGADIEWDYDSGAVPTSTYRMVSNRTTPGTINFNLEFDTYLKTYTFPSLFERFYENYIKEIYGALRRLVTVNAYLPSGFILTYGMNDKIIIHGKKYKINSINIDLIDGKSTLELITE